MKCCLLACVVVSWSAVSPGRCCAENWVSKLANRLSPIPAPLCCSDGTCGNCYARKPIPCMRPKQGFCCDNYCRPEAPSVCRKCSFCCDDYRRKPCPAVRCPQCKRHHCRPTCEPVIDPLGLSSGATSTPQFDMQPAASTK